MKPSAIDMVREALGTTPWEPTRRQLIGICALVALGIIAPVVAILIGV